MAAQTGLKIPNRAHGRWSDDETEALIEVWKPLYKRRREGEVDLWLPERQHSVVRTCRDLVAEDWREVAFLVNQRRTAAGHKSYRTHDQCRLRLDHVRATYWKKVTAAAPSPWPFLAALRDVWAPAGEPVPPPPVQLELAQHQEQENVGDGAEEDGRGSGADDAEAEDMKAEQVKREGARRDAARDTRRAAATHVPDVAAGDDHRRRAPSTVGVVPIPKRARTAARVSGSARVSEDVFRAAVADLVAGGALGVAPTTVGSGAVSAAAAEVLIKISDVCQNVMLRSFDVEAEAAEAARCACAGRRP